MIATPSTLTLLLLAGWGFWCALHSLLIANPRLLSGDNHLDTSGILGVIRHPWYVTTFLLLWAQDLTVLSIQVNAVLSVYLVVATFLEERKLVQEFGDHYRDYQRRVGMFVPIQWLRAKPKGGGG